MPLFIAVHKWKPELQVTIMKEMIAGFTELLQGTAPKGVELCFTWQRADYGAFCLWNVPNKEALESFFKKFGPTMPKYTEFIPVLQVYPPTPEYVLSLFQNIIDLSTKK